MEHTQTVELKSGIVLDIYWIEDAGEIEEAGTVSAELWNKLTDSEREEVLDLADECEWTRANKVPSEFGYIELYAGEF